MIDKKAQNKKGIMAMIGCTIIMAVNVSYQVVMTAFPSVRDGLGIDTVQASLMTTVLTGTVLVMALIGTRLIDKLTPRWSMLIGTLLCTFFLIGNSFVTNYPAFVMLGAIAGAGSALGTLAACAGVMKQFWGKKAGRMFALITGAQTLITAGYMALVGILLQVTDYRTVFLIIAAITIVLGVCANLFLIKKPDQELVKKFEEEEKADKEAELASAATTKGWTLPESFKHSPIYLFIFGVIAASIISGGFTTFITIFLVDNGIDKSMASYYMSFFTIICGVHMAYSGYFQAKFGNRGFFIFFYSMVIIGFIALTIWIDIKTIPMTLLCLTLIGCIKPIMTTAAVVVPDLFGNKDYVAYNSFTQAMFNAGKMIATFTTALILQYLGGVAMSFFFAALALIAMVAFLASDKLSPFSKKGKKRTQKNQVEK